MFSCPFKTSVICDCRGVWSKPTVSVSEDIFEQEEQIAAHNRSVERMSLIFKILPQPSALSALMFSQLGTVYKHMNVNAQLSPYCNN